jgi:HemY protein
MRGLFWVILLAALAVAVTVGARYNSGYILLVLHPYRVEMSLNLLLAVLLLAFIAGYALVRVIARTLRLPIQVREFREKRRLLRAQRSLLDALRAYLEGRYAQAEKAAAQSVELGENAGIAAVIAARAAHELRSPDRRDRYLARSAHFNDDDRTLRAIAQAEMLLLERKHQEALAALETLPHKHTAALRLELRAVQQARNWDRYLELLAQLEKLHALDEVQVTELRRYAICENLARKGTNPDDLRVYWQRLGQRERLNSKIAAEAARMFIAYGEGRDAQQIIEASLEREWNSELVGLYAECVGDDAVRRIERAEAWLKRQPSDPALLLALGRLCAKQRLWGKARTYIEASLSLDDSFETSMALARLLDEMGEHESARLRFARSLEIAEAQLTRPRPNAVALKEVRPPLLPAPKQG